jgi:hypothetical protein
MQMIKGGFGVEDQDAAAGIAGPLGGQVFRGQLPLTRPPGRIGLGVVGQQHPGGSQAVGDGGCDPGEILDLGGVDEHPQPMIAEGLDGLAVGPG